MFLNVKICKSRIDIHLASVGHWFRLIESRKAPGLLLHSEKFECRHRWRIACLRSYLFRHPRV